MAPVTLKRDDQISHYRIVGPLGAGGMGEVYRAQDQSLERDVALKILPPELVASEERVRRFVLEAKSASSLNHPHIVTIYEIGRDRVRAGDGPPEPDSSPLHFISMELISGETLTTKIHREKSDLKTLLGYLAQAAEGLSKAHGAGIVHRDLKPGNIMVSTDGYAKVLDFGLAKLTERQAVGPEVASAPTQTEEGTKRGTVMGTVDYMSPEQVQGKPADHRSDIFSFGCILYEAATRRRPFAAESDVETMHRILREEPEPVQSLNPKAPADLRRLIRRCLVKNPDQRLDSIRALAIELREIIEEYDALSTTPSPGSGVPAILPDTRRRRMRVWIPVAVTVGAVVIAAILFRYQGPPRLGQHMTFQTLSTPSPTISYPGLSPDGKWVAYGAADEQDHWDIYLMNVNGGEIRRVTSDSSAFVEFVDISPDGSKLVYESQATTNGPREIHIVSSLGGASTTLPEQGGGPRWSPDGSRIGFIAQEDREGRRVTTFHTIRPDGTEHRTMFADSITFAGGTGTHVSFSWSPGGKKVAWIRNYPGLCQELMVHDLATGRERQLTHDQRIIDEVHWTSQDQIIFSSNRGGNVNLWVVRASGGLPAQLTRGSGPDVGMRVSADARRMIYLERRESDRLWISPTDVARPARVTNEDLRLGGPSISPDGRKIGLLVRRDPIGTLAQLYVMNRDGTGRRPLAVDGWTVDMARWSPGGLLAFSGRGPGDPVDSTYVYIVDPQGSGPPRRIVQAALPTWVDSTTLSVARGTRRWLVSSDGAHLEPLGPDSTFTFPSTNRRYSLVFDQRGDRRGDWVRIPAMGPESLAVYRKLDSGFSPIVHSRGADFVLLFPRRGHAERVSLPDLHHSPIPGTFSTLDPQTYTCSLRWDGKELVYIEPQVTTKLVMIDNLR